MNISEQNIEELRFLTYPGSFGKDKSFFVKKENNEMEDCFGDRYDKYLSLMESNKIKTTDIILIRDILLFSESKVTLEQFSDLEEFLLDLFVRKNNGSLTREIKGDFIKKYSYLFMELDEINKKMAPVIFFDKNKDYDFEFYNSLKNCNNSSDCCDTLVIKDYNIDIEKTYYCGFHKYIKAAVLFKKNLKERLDKNTESLIKVKKETYRDAIEKSIKNMEYKPCLEQKVAIANSMINKSFSVISGGPGTGKTTVVFSLLNSLYNLDTSLNVQDIVLLAPTGRAAGRIEEAVKEAAEKLSKKETNPFLEGLKKIQGQTIHKYLFPIDLKKKENKKKDKVVIVDEVSMVDIYLMSSLLENLSVDTRLVLVGDYNQLPSVDTGCVMADLSRGRENEDVFKSVKDILELNDENFNGKSERNENKSNIPMEFVTDLKVNHRADVEDLKKAFVEIENDDKNLDSIKEIKNLSFEPGAFILDEKDVWKKRDCVFDFLKYGFFEKDDNFGKSYLEYVTEITGKIDFSKSIFDLNSDEGKLFEKLFKHINKYKVLCPNRKGKLGCERINENFIKEYRKKCRVKNSEFVLGQPIMVVKNDYKLNVSNGENGIALCDKSGIYKIVFKVKENYVAYLATNFEYFENAFAVTVHKSQGSEYDNVIIPIEEYSEFITKELLYTALTRAKKSFVLMTDKNTVCDICENKIKRENQYDLY